MRYVVLLLAIVFPGVVFAGTVPDVTGLTVQEALTLLKQAGYEITVQWTDGPPNLVAAQEPPGFSTRPEGTRIILRAGANAARAPRERAKAVPALIGMTASAARDEMKAWPNAVEEQSLVVSELVGKVVHQWPAAGESVPSGDHLIVVTGIDELPSKRHKTVPFLEGQTVEKARATAKTAGFTLTVEEVEALPEAPALVMAQFPLAGSLAEQATAVRVRVPKAQAKTPPSDEAPSAAAPDTLQAPTLVLPAENDSLRGPTVGFDWNAVKGATRYEVEIEREGANATWKRVHAAVSKGTSLRRIELPRGRYRWRVRALGDDSRGPWGTPRPFYVFGR